LGLSFLVPVTDIAVHTIIVEVLMFAGGCYFLYQGFVLNPAEVGTG